MCTVCTLCPFDWNLSSFWFLLVFFQRVEADEVRWVRWLASVIGKARDKISRAGPDGGGSVRVRPSLPVAKGKTENVKTKETKLVDGCAPNSRHASPQFTIDS